MRKSLFFFSLLFSPLFTSLYGSNGDSHPRVLVLLIASDDAPLYIALQEIWRCYMHRDPDHIQAYFMKGDPDLPTNYLILDDEIWIKTEENVIPGLLNKTVLSLEAFLPQLKNFDYVLRTNLSSFYVFPRFLEFIRALPLTNCYCGAIGGEGNLRFASGAGFLISPDIAELIVKHKTELLNSNIIDDMRIGLLLSRENIPILSAPRTDLLDLNAWILNQYSIPQSAFHFRIKNPDASLRLESDIYIQLQLLKMFYGIVF